MLQSFFVILQNISIFKQRLHDALLGAWHWKENGKWFFANCKLAVDTLIIIFYKKNEYANVMLIPSSHNNEATAGYALV